MVTPYIVFNKQCEAALEFYERIFKGEEKELIRYNDYVPETNQELPDDLSDYILHAKMKIYGTEFTFADEFTRPVVEGNMVHLTITPNNIEEGKRIYDELKDGGEVFLPITETFYSPLHAAVKDKFGITWNIIVA
jgi:PhnB protein